MEDNIMEEILNNFRDAIKNYVDKIVSNLYFDKTIQSMIAAIDNDLYKVFYHKQEYYVKNGTGINFTVGDNVWLTIPCNDFKKMYISARR